MARLEDTQAGAALEHTGQVRNEVRAAVNHDADRRGQLGGKQA
jgi:hypothetical protein